MQSDAHLQSMCHLVGYGSGSQELRRSGAGLEYSYEPVLTSIDMTLIWSAAGWQRKSHSCRTRYCVPFCAALSGGSKFREAWASRCLFRLCSLQGSSCLAGQHEQRTARR